MVSIKSPNSVYDFIPETGIGETELATHCSLNLSELRSSLSVLVRDKKIERCDCNDRPYGFGTSSSTGNGGSSVGGFPDIRKLPSKTGVPHWQKVIHRLQPQKILDAIPIEGTDEIELAMQLEASIPEVKTGLKQLASDGKVYEQRDKWYACDGTTQPKVTMPLLGAVAHGGNPQDLAAPQIAVVDKSDTDETQLSDDERQELIRLERKIERGFYEAGKALAEIREQRLYRDKWKAFEAYCKDRFSMGRSYANRQIAAAEVCDSLVDILVTNCHLSQGECDSFVIPLPTCEGQCRPLTVLSPEHRAVVWEAAVEENKGRVPSEAKVKKVVEELKRRLNKVPNPYREGQIVVRSFGKRGYWWIIKEVGNFTCTCANWQGSEQIPHPDLLELEFPPDLRAFMQQLQERLLKIWQKTDQLNKQDLASVRGSIEAIALNASGFLTDTQEQILQLFEVMVNRNEN